MIKEQALRKRLIKFSIIALVAVSASGAVAFGVYSWSSSLQEQVKNAKNKLSAAQRDVTSRESKNKDAQQYLELYQRITGESEQAKISDLSREKAQIWLKNAARKNDIVNLEGSFEPVVAIDAPAFKKKTLEGITSQVKLKFGAMTDEQIYRFVDSIQNDFPGYVKVSKFELNRKGEISDATLIAAGKGQFPELVSGIMEFNWIGVREIAEDKPTDQSQQRR